MSYNTSWPGINTNFYLFKNNWNHFFILFHLQGLLYSHDAVAQKDYYPHLPEIPRDPDEVEEDTIKIVQLVKSNEPLVCC